METPTIGNIVNNLNLGNSEMLRLHNVPSDMLAVLQNGAKASLKIAFSDSAVLTSLEINNQVFNVEIEGTLPQPSANQIIELPVKISSGNRLQILPNNYSPSSPATTDFQPDVQTTKTSSALNIEINPSKQLEPIRPEPLKLDEFISQKLNELQTPKVIQKQIINNLPRLQISFSSVGKEIPNTEDLLRPLNDTLQQISVASAKEDIISLQNRLQQNITDLIGRSFNSEITRQINQTTFFNTDFGESFFNSSLKLQPHEHITYTVTDIISSKSNPPEEILGRLLDLFGETQTDITQSLRQDSQILATIIKNPSSISQSATSPLINILADKLPAYNRNILPNMVNFYQAALHKDASIWLGHDNIEQISALSDRNVISELNNFVASAVKDTPLWRIVEIPVYAENNFTPLKIALKKDQDKHNEKEKSSPGTRFVVETQFSKLGGFQFDGFVRAGERNLDLIIRTTEMPDDDFCSQIINLFKNSLYNLDYKGNIKINRRDNFINFYEDTPKGQGIYI